VLHPKKVDRIPTQSGNTKRTNEIKTAIPLLDAIPIEGKTISADALLTQKALATYLVETRKAHFHFTVKGNQKALLEDLTAAFQNRLEPDASETSPPLHGRIETRRIWVTPHINDYLDFPHVQQAFLIERESYNKKSGKISRELAYGITSCPREMASPTQVIAVNRGHWVIENSCHHILDCLYDEDRSRISKGHGPENMTRLRRFAIGLIKSKGCTNVSEKTRELNRNPRMVFDYLKMSKNTHKREASLAA